MPAPNPHLSRKYQRQMTAKRDLSEFYAAREWRVRMGLTREALTEISGYGKTSIAAFESGHQSSGEPVDPAAFRRYKMVCASIHAGIVFDWKTATLEVVKRETVTVELPDE